MAIEKAEVKKSDEGSVSMTQLAEILKNFAAELKKPDEETQRKLADEKQRKLTEHNQNVVAEMEQKLLQAGEQLNCQHKKANGNHTFAGRVLTGGDVSVRCCRCQYEIRWRASNEEMAQGIDLQAQGNENITVEQLLAQAKARPPKRPASTRGYAELKKELDTFKSQHGIVE